MIIWQYWLKKWKYPVSSLGKFVSVLIEPEQKSFGMKFSFCEVSDWQEFGNLQSGNQKNAFFHGYPETI